MNKKVLLIVFLLLSIVAVFGYEFWQETINRQKQDITTVQSSTDTLIANLERKLANKKDDINLSLSLANAYLQKVRETADSDLYKKVDDLLDSTEKKNPDNPDILATRAQVALGRHDFVKALELGQQAQLQNPENAVYLGIITDAHIELGNYEEALKSLQKMMDIKPNYSSFTRTAYLRELYGDREGAQEALEKAQSAGAPYPENSAANLVELGKLYLRTDVKKADQTFKQALSVYKDYPPALEGLGSVAFARKEYKKAISYFEKAFRILPIANYATHLGDVYTKIGEGETANKYYILAKVAYEKAEQSGVNTDLEAALFLADHDIELDQALKKTQAEYLVRPDNIYVADALAWTLHKNGRSEEAQKYVALAMRLGEHHPLILFHAGVIAGKNNNPEEAKRLFQKALSLHPHFSLQYAQVLSVL